MTEPLPRNGLVAHSVKFHEVSPQDAERMTDEQIARAHSEAHRRFGAHLKGPPA